MTTKPSLAITAPDSKNLFVSALFGAGVGIETQVGISLSQLLCDRLGVSQEYLDHRIQTIFVNGRTVDHPDQALIEEDATVALSAAMPGLVGATFRKDGLLAVFRKDISQIDGKKMDGPQKKTMITLKLFNLVAKELGPSLLERGVWLKGKQLARHIERIGESTPALFEAVVWNDHPIPADQLPAIQWPEGWVHFVVHA